MNSPCHLLLKDDLIKVGRVRFKVREIESPVYCSQHATNELSQRKHKLLYPSFSFSDDESFPSDQTSMAAHSRELLSEEAPAVAGQGVRGSVSISELNS